MARFFNRFRENINFNFAHIQNRALHQPSANLLRPEDEVDASEELYEDPLSPSAAQKLIQNLSENFLYALNELRENSLLCDAVITVSDSSFQVHRAVLCCSSAYFRAQFTGFGQSNVSNEEESRYLVIPGITGAIMEQCILFAYTHQCAITPDNVHELLITADYLGMTGLVHICKIHLASMITPENCISTMAFAKFRFLDDLYAKARNYLMRYFVDVSQRSREILDIDLNDFYEIINDDELNAREEDNVWKMVLKWIDHDPGNRKPCIALLLYGVRMGLMSTKCFMEEAKVHPYVVECEDCEQLISDTQRFMIDLDEMNAASGEIKTPQFAMPRVPHEVIFAIGGWSGGTSKACIEAYDTRADRWVIVTAEDPAGPRAYHGTAVIGFRIYTIGGYDGVEYFNTCRVFDAYHKNWKEIAPMHCRRCYVSVTELNGFIYAIGGYDGHNRLNTVERYNPKTNQWTVVAPMNMQRSDASACSLKGKIYATGGFNGQECLDSAEYYDPATNVWTRIPNMNHRRSGVSCVAYRNCVYVIGGFNGTARLSTGERYDPETQIWSFIREMNHSRSNFGLEIIDDMILAIGGFNGVSTISHTECYIAETDEWMEATDMNIVRSALTASNVSGLPNKRDYIHKYRDRLMEERRQRLIANSIAQEEAISNSSTDVQNNATVEYESPNEDDDAVDDNNDADDEENNEPLPIALPIQAIPMVSLQQRNDQVHADQRRRYRVQLRGQRHGSGSHHDMRRRA